ncbi:MAG: lytic transglycosylase domain-containing protein [Bacteroidales bacterium]|nr:lytic transglycosylase domain-containing protein [Bacteroidales bacterium]MBN2758290.1 lytic transglycosylase domain-containing protein [Bacteroidales bacterium]
MAVKKKSLKIIEFMKNFFYVIASLVIILVVFNLFSYSKSRFENEKTKVDTIMQIVDIQSFQFPEKLDFAGEKVPLENFDIRESLDKEILKVAYWHSEMILYLKRANRIFPVIEPILKKNGVPDDFKYLMVTESGLVNVVSPAKAEGYWQFMDKTAKEFGLEVNKEVDERYHLKKSTEAACKYLKKRKQKFGSWTMAAASYNAGENGMNNYVEYQEVNSYYDLAMFSETGRYVFRTLAIKLIMQNPKEYGFILKKEDLYPKIATYEIEIDTAITDMIAFSKKHDINYKLLKMFNPWLRSHELTNKAKKKYIIDIPEKGARSKKYN